MRILALLLFLMPVAAIADPAGIQLNLDRVSVVELANLVYGDILKENYVLDPQLIQKNDQVTVHFQTAYDKAKLSAFMVNLLSGIGITVDKKQGYTFLRSSDSEEGEELFFYRPRYRSVSYILDLAGTLFKSGRFSLQRSGISSSSALPSGAALPSSSMSSSSSTVPKAVETGTNAYSLIDKQQDAFIFRGPPSDVAKLRSLLEQIDTPAGEVLVKAVVYEVTGSDQEGSAIQSAISLLNSKLSLSINAGATPFPNALSINTANFKAVLSALSSDTRFKVVSEPFLKVKSGASARVSVGQDVPVLGNVQLDKNGNPVQSVEYKPSGVILNIKPEIRDASIDLTINQQLSNFIPTTTGVNNSPTLIKREISTQVGASEDDVIVLGGLKEEKTSSDESGFPFLPKFLWSKGTQKDTSEILLILNVKKI
jgi:type II secretory pathway component GspD/PulD (secretin)